MSNDFRNEYAFSFSSFKAFRACPRRWWLSKVAFWRGWERGARPEVRLAYVLTKMTGVFAFAGAIVHEIAADLARGRAPALDAAQRRFHLAMDRGWQQSVSGGWERDPKHVVNLAEVYYSHPEALERRRRAELAGDRALRALYDPAFPPFARLRDGGRVDVVERLEKMHVPGDREGHGGDVPVWVQIDLATQEGGLYWLTDYKTGRPRTEHRAQAVLYALFYVLARRIPRQRLRVELAYLRDGSVDAWEPTEEEIAAAQALIPEAANEIRQLLDPPGDVNAGPMENFPMTEDPEVCRDCFVFHACKGTREIPGGLL